VPVACGATLLVSQAGTLRTHVTSNTAEPDVPVEAAQQLPARATFLPWLVWVWAAVEAALLAGAMLLFPETLVGPSTAENVGFAAFLVTLAFAVMAFATAGLLVTRQQPRNAVGWAMLSGGPALGAVFVGYMVGVAILEADPVAGSWFVLLGVVLFGPAFFLLGPTLASVFPDGRLLQGWWTRAFWLCATGIVLSSVLAAVAPGPVEEGIDVANPLGMSFLPFGLRDVANGVMAISLVAGGIIAVASLVARYRRSGSVARHQLKWFLYAVAAWAVVLPISLMVAETFTAILAIVALTLVPAAVVVAIRRYRLYEIDNLINKTLVYVPLVGIVAGLFAGLTTLLQAVFTAVTGNTSDAAAVISALAMASLFTPIQNWLQTVVDRRFKPEEVTEVSQWDDPEFRAAVEAIVRDVTGQRG
jgi:hypothetical protein